jgi:hypothetical protein
MTLNQKVEVTDLGLVYEIPMSKNNSRLQVYYLTKNIKASDASATVVAYGLDDEFTRTQAQLGAVSGCISRP